MGVFALVIVACGESHNTAMTRLLNKQKSISDSIAFYRGMEKQYQDSAFKINDYKGADSLNWKMLIGVAARANDRWKDLQSQLPAVAFSIDSLQKMK